MAQFSELIVDGVLALLLVAVIVVCTIVYRRLGTIKAGQAELKTLVNQLNSAAMVAQRSVEALKASAQDVAGQLTLESQKASAILDELSLMTEAGNNLADRIEKGLTGANSAKTLPSGAEKKENKKQQQAILAALREAR
jgi:Domain of unknown function (DUF6468)